jgi:GNAT superfamily N-acetyltransferase
LDFHTYESWDEAIWLKVEPIYDQAFAENGRKNKKIIRKLFEKQMCYLHVGMVDSDVIAMALTGKVEHTPVLLIDYLAVREDRRIQGLGQEFMHDIKTWASSKQYDRIIIEIESDTNPTNLSRFYFWEKCGFTITDYIHHYIWVPEPYQAMYLNLRPNPALPKDGETLFKQITQFHKIAYSGR